MLPSEPLTLFICTTDDDDDEREGALDATDRSDGAALVLGQENVEVAEDEGGGVVATAAATVTAEELVEGGDGDDGPETQLELLPLLPRLDDDTGSLGVGVSLESRFTGVPDAAKSTSIIKPSSSSSSSISSSSLDIRADDDFTAAATESSASSVSRELLAQTLFEGPDASTEVDEQDSPLSTPEEGRLPLCSSDASTAEETAAVAAVAAADVEASTSGEEEMR